MDWAQKAMAVGLQEKNESLVVKPHDTSDREVGPAALSLERIEPAPQRIGVGPIDGAFAEDISGADRARTILLASCRWGNPAPLHSSV